MLDKLKQRLLDVLNWTPEDLQNFQFATDAVLHDPFLYTDMDQFVSQLHIIDQDLKNHPDALLIVDTDYDTDGIMSACVLHAALAVFEINHKIYIPQVKDGYGLSTMAVKKMEEEWQQNGQTIRAILTADNGTNAIDGITYAKEQGIDVLVTDHHLGSDILAPANVIINPNKPGDTYPFKGNAGAAVAYKAMQAYAKTYYPDRLNLINQLIVFAGIANVSDVMPITDENHYMVKQAVNFTSACQTGSMSHLPDTPFDAYNDTFEALYLLIQYYQILRDEDRKAQRKSSSNLPSDEQLISWYLSPLLNAPRRVVDSPATAFSIFFAPTQQDKINSIKQCYQMNKEKSHERDAILQAIDPKFLAPNSNVIFANTRPGISGLVAGQLTQQTGHPSIVFTLNSNYPKKIYGYPDLKSEVALSGSARSQDIPLPLIIQQIQEWDDQIILGGGGHANAAGYRIRGDKLKTFVVAFERATLEVAKQLKNLQPTLTPTLQNRVVLSFGSGESTLDYLWIDMTTLRGSDIKEVISFQESLKPFGHQSLVQSHFEMWVNPCDFLNYQYDPDFWKTFKVRCSDYEILTFNQSLSNVVKDALANRSTKPLKFTAELSLNEFRGKVTPQIRLLELI